MDFEPQSTPFRVGDIIYVRRYRSGLVVYHHAGVVLEVEGGLPTRVIHWDPAFDDAHVPFDQVITGFMGPPRFLEGREEVEQSFGLIDTRILKRRNMVFTPQQINERAEEAYNHGDRLYQLFSNNCQHFANELVYGVPFSLGVSHILPSVNHGFNTGISNTRAVSNYLSPMMDRVQPFSNNNIFGSIGNAAIGVILFIVLIIILVIVFSLSFAASSSVEYLRRVNRD